MIIGSVIINVTYDLVVLLHQLKAELEKPDAQSNVIKIT